LFCNDDGPHVAAVREACARIGLSLDVIGRALGDRISSLEADVGGARATIGNMQRSRFWEARKVWVAVRGWRPY
jgi:hypothetical protein